MGGPRRWIVMGLVVFLVTGFAWWRWSDTEAELSPTYRIAEVDAEQGGTLIRVRVSDSCSGTSAVALAREGDDDVVLSSERGTFARCADGGDSPGTVELKTALGDRTLIIEQPKRFGPTEPVLCVVDGETSDQCTERFWSE